MNPLTQLKKRPILSLLIVPALVGVAAFTATPALATPSCGVLPNSLALGHFPDGSLDLMCNESNLTAGTSR